MSSPRPLSRRKRLLFSVVLVLLLVGFTELVSLLWLNFSLSDVISRRSLAAATNPLVPTDDFNFPMMLHPYIGTVYQPQIGSQPHFAGPFHITEYGFLDSGPPVRKRSADKVIVGLMGGSVAREMATTSSEFLAQELSRIPEFKGRSFDFVRMAVDGHKQPQQYMALSYLLTLGAEFDLLINLDGLNEIALPGMDNVPLGVFAAYPRQWGAATNSVGSIELMRRIGLLIHLRTERRDCAQWYHSLPLRYSPTAALIWNARNIQHDDAIVRQLKEIQRRREVEKLSYCSSGPAQKFETKEQLYQHCAQLWGGSSILMHQLCQARQIRYFHFLQPNQYVAGSKPIGSAEAQVAISDSSPFEAAVVAGYPIMRGKAKELQGAGVAFTDLTQVFSEHPEPLYKDDCCHVSDPGSQIMAKAIGARIREWFSEQSLRR